LGNVMRHARTDGSSETGHMGNLLLAGAGVKGSVPLFSHNRRGVGNGQLIKLGCFNRV
jgi:hypothetical protein